MSTNDNLIKGLGAGTMNLVGNLVLDASGNNAAGFVPSKLTSAQRDAIVSPPSGLLIFNITTNKLNVFTTVWEAVTSA
jgi:hypothetical protein